MHYFFKGEPRFQFANVSPSSLCPIWNFGQTRSMVHLVFFFNAYNDRKLCDHENDYNHKDDIVERHILLHD
jgi:hypothetical protein